METPTGYPTAFKLTAFLIALLSLLIVHGCAVIPQSDTTLPEVKLDIRGPGIGRQVMSNPPRASWTGPRGVQLFDLEPDTEYHFFLTVIDRGGVEEVFLAMPNSFTVRRLTGNPTERITGISRTLRLRGRRDNPTAILGFNGILRTPPLASRRALSFEFLARGVDFGGRAGARNSTFLSVNATVNAGVP